MQPAEAGRAQLPFYRTASCNLTSTLKIADVGISHLPTIHITPYDRKQPVFEAYVQNNTPGAYRIFWCYGPKNGAMTIIAITSHP